MTPQIAAAASDLVLVLACGRVLLRAPPQPGLALAALLVGTAAALGSLRFGGVEMLAGAHRFASLVSACAALPLLAWALRWPADPLVATSSGATRAALLAGGIGVGATVLGASAWGPAVSVIAAAVITLTMVQRRDPVGLAGAAALLAGLGAAAAGAVLPFDATVVLHLGLATALVLLASAPRRAVA